MSLNNIVVGPDQQDYGNLYLYVTDISSFATVLFPFLYVLCATMFISGENCGESFKKQKVRQHITSGPCRGASVTCIDCLKVFHGFEFESHTSCVSEAERYQGKLYHPPKKDQPKPQTAPVQQQTPPSSLTKQKQTPSKDPDPKSTSVSTQKTPAPQPRTETDFTSWHPLNDLVKFDWKSETLKLIAEKKYEGHDQVKKELQKRFFKALKKQSKPYISHLASHYTKKCMKKK